MEPSTLLFTESHEWIEAGGDVLRMGISDHAQHLLGDIVFVDLPKVGKTVGAGDEILVVESPKAAASVYAPVSGEIVEVNENLDGSPDTINQSPYGDGWIVKIRPSSLDADKANLMTHDAYLKKIEEE
jgi:glycine cleavage system H protein